jgi:hypothetical protein
MAKKNTQSLHAKFRFSSIAPECTATRLQIIQILYITYFCEFFKNLKSNGLYLAMLEKKFENGRILAKTSLKLLTS